MRLGVTPADSSTAKGPTSGALEYERALDAVCSSLRDPVAKLRFIRESLTYYDTVRRRVGWVPSALLRRRLYVWLAIERFRPLLESGALTPGARSQLRRSLVAGRALVGAAALGACGLLVAVGLALFVVVPQTFARPVPPPTAEPARLARRPAAPQSRPEPVGATTPGAVWLVEKGGDFEQYSNGLRIDTTFTTRSPARRFHTFDADGMLPEVYTSPVGILFHTSESDVWPLEETFNENLRDSSQRLLRYLRREEVYNYLIDRFGRVYRVVDDACKVNHAGHSIWARQGRFYLSLNNAFLGVCFETRWEGGRALPITAAQFAAGRNLTDGLRHRFGIVAEMCVAHGLTSVNGKKHLIGHHVDWARGFPFEAFGLPNQYDVPPPSVGFFGFGYDEHFLQQMGEPWPGVRAAEQSLTAEAESAGTTVDDLRRLRRALYDRWVAEQARDDERATSGRADRGPTRGHQGG